MVLLVTSAAFAQHEGWPPATCVRGNDGVARCGYDCRTGGDGHTVCADTPSGRCGVGADEVAVCTQHPTQLPNVGSWPPAECSQGGDGHVACGYHCQVGGDGVAACANTPNGRCAVDNEGHAICSRFAFLPSVGSWPRAACVRGGDGHIACGYACRTGGDGVAVCADTPNGSCTVGGDAHAVCSELGRAAVRGVDPSRWPAPACVRGADGSAACGYGCRVGGTGGAACADTPNGRCTVGGDGVVVCGP